MIDRKQFKTLTNIIGEHCISFFIPTYRAGQEQEDRIRYKNILSKVNTQLSNRGLSPQAINKILAEANSKVDDIEFWQYQSDGLAVFIYDDQTLFFNLPIDFSPFLYVGEQLYLKPLLPVLTGNIKFYLLAISQNEVRFFEGDKYSITEIETKEYLPASMEDLMRFIEGEETIQHHSGRGNQDTAIFHGQGSGKDMSKVRLREYTRMINKGIMELMCDDDTAPLILATVDETAAIYREENEYAHLMSDFIPGNSEQTDPVLLHEKAWNLMRPQVESNLQERQEEFEAALANNEASFSMIDVVPAAIVGRVKHLFVAKDDEIWGIYDGLNHRIQIHEFQQENSIPLINKAVMSTYLNGGTVHVIPRTELPRTTSSMNAIYRYSVVPA